MKPPSPALAVSCLALAIALGGTGYAVTQLPKNSVGTAQIKNNAVTGAKVKAGSLDATDFKTGALLASSAGPQGTAGPSGAAGPQGTAGPSGAAGARGPSNGYFTTTSGAATTIIASTSPWTTVGTISLPPGKYIATATTNVSSTVYGVGLGTGQSVEVDCYFPVEIDTARETARVYRQGTAVLLDGLTVVQPLPVTASIDLSGATGNTALTVGCLRDSTSGTVTANTEGVTISAIKVETLG
jgi:hypothetical protein